jgi:hypothetical protein
MNVLSINRAKGVSELFCVIGILFLRFSDEAIKREGANEKLKLCGTTPPLWK